MKNSNLFLICMMFVALFFTACNKDQELLTEEAGLTNTETQYLEAKRNCGMDHHMSKLLEDPTYRKAHAKKIEAIENMSSSRAACSSPVVLPIAVHFQGISNPDVACLRQLAQSQVAILNADYQGSNSDINKWGQVANSFPGISNGEACIEFCLASTNHPTGFNLNNGDPAVTVNQTNGDSNNAWAGYINLFVRANTGVLGYSPLGGSGNGDGVVIDANAFGSGSGCGSISPNSPYDLGRTLTHELGHYLLLDHIWGGGCNQDDGVSDTPNSAQEYYGCPTIGASSCSSTDMFMNYMDYVNDACMFMFSAGQATRMENYVNSSLSHVIAKGQVTCGSGGGGPTCNDGVMNGDETGVDCGGSCTPCQVAPTCNDGVMNGDETGVDCGGSCTPCQVAPTCNDGVMNGDETGVDCGGSCAPCQTGSGKIKVIIKPDNYGSEIYWELLDEDYNVVLSGGPYADGDTTIKRKTITADAGCYTFYIEDYYGDGICCDYGTGWYKIKDGAGNILESSDGQYGYWEEVTFCTGQQRRSNDTKTRRDEKRTDLPKKGNVTKK